MSEGFSSRVPECVVDVSHEHRGVVMPKVCPPRALQCLQEFRTREDDIFVITFPKSGTTWVQLIALSVQLGGDINKLNDSGPHLMAKMPFLEAVMNPLDPDNSPIWDVVVDSMPSPRHLKCHCLIDWLPGEIRTDDPKAKVIYVARNPKDTAVSFFHFCHYTPYLPSYESWDCFFEHFIAGLVPWGSWFDNVLPWWKRRHHDRVLFLKYEDLIKEPHAGVRKIAQFMDMTLDEDAVNNIVSATSFGVMKKSQFANPDVFFHGELIKTDKSFFRKGVVGDWKNYFTEKQNKQFDELYRSKLAGTSLEFDFEPPDHQLAKL